MDDAALPGGAREGLLDGTPQPLVGIGDDADDVRHAAVAQAPQEPEPGCVGLRVDRVDADEVAVTVVGGRYRRHHGHGADMPTLPGLDVGGIRPQVREPQVVEDASLQVGDRLVERGAHPGDGVLAEPVGTERVGHTLDLPRRDTTGDHLGHGRHDRAVGHGVSLHHVLGEEGPAPELGYAKGDRAYAREQRALPVAVPLVATLALEVGLDVHRLIDDGLGEHPRQLAHVHHPVVEPGQPRCRTALPIAYDCHSGHRLS